MRLKHFEYITLAIDAYNKKRVNHELSPLLTQSTPGNIRRECANVYQERYEKKDEPVLRAFFGPAEHGRKFLAVIQKFDVNKFKPLDKYLKGDGKERISDRNLDLLAWLIDFNHRPYSSDNDVQLSEEELSVINNTEKSQAEPVPGKNALQPKEQAPEIASEKEIEGVPGKNKEESPIPFIPFTGNITKVGKLKKALIVLVLIICTGGIYAIWQQTQGKQVIMGNSNTGCMYWADDHYERVPCNEERKGRLILPLSEEKLKNFKRIAKEDTITEKSIAKIYYIKNEGKIEYFTAGGSHPVEVTRTLKVLSPYMFDKYLRKKEAPHKDSLAEQRMKFINNK
jgi:hypothetical protein